MKPFLDTVDRPLTIANPMGGARFLADDGKVYLDLWADAATLGNGYVNAPQNGELIQLSDTINSPVRTEFAKKLCEKYGGDYVVFGTSGAEAVEIAIRFARKWHWEHGDKFRKEVRTVKGNFHGRTMSSSGASDSEESPYHKTGFATTMIDETLHRHGFPWLGYGEPINPVSAHWASDVENWEEMAAVITGPILGNNQVREWPGRFLPNLSNVCADTGTLLIYDEIQTGGGITGFHSAAEYYSKKFDDDLTPDITVLGKRIAGGFPMSAVILRNSYGRDWKNIIGSGEHFSTFAGSPYGARMGLDWMDWLDEGGLEKIKADGEYIEMRLEPLADEIHRVGMMTSFIPNTLPGPEFAKKALERGVIVASRHKDVRITPPLTVPRGDLEEAFDRLAGLI